MIDSSTYTFVEFLLHCNWLIRCSITSPLLSHGHTSLAYSGLLPSELSSDNFKSSWHQWSLMVMPWPGQLRISADFCIDKKVSGRSLKLSKPSVQYCCTCQLLHEQKGWLRIGGYSQWISVEQSEQGKRHIGMCDNVLRQCTDQRSVYCQCTGMQTHQCFYSVEQWDSSFVRYTSPISYLLSGKHNKNVQSRDSEVCTTGLCTALEKERCLLWVRKSIHHFLKMQHRCRSAEFVMVDLWHVSPVYDVAYYTIHLHALSLVVSQP